VKRISRRKFIHQAISGLGAVTISHMIAGCQSQETPIFAPTEASSPPPTVTLPVVTSTQPGTTVSPSTTPPPVPTAAGANPTPTIESSATKSTPPEMVVARGSDPAELVRQAMAAMGGIDQYVKNGAKVVIKPNICVAYGTFDNAYTTNPWVVGALVKLCFEAGAASVHVMDYPFNGTAAVAYKKSGIEAQVLENGGEMVLMTGYKFISTTIPQGKEIKKMGIYDEILKADALINVPIAKHHSLAGLTLAMKNLLGIVDYREIFHPNFSQRLPDLSTIVKPTLNVLDAVRILMNNGPASGTKDDIKQLDTIIITPDIVAADAYATTLFGKKPEYLNYIQVAAERNIGRMDIGNLRIAEIKVGG
jgi:uncharacterized protein (DUF362 family)